MGSKITGIKEVQDKLGQISDKVKELDGVQEVPLSELFTDDFLSEISNFNSLSDMINQSGFQIDSAETFNEVISSKDWNSFIRENTSSSSWDNLLKSATTSYFKKKIGM